MDQRDILKNRIPENNLENNELDALLMDAESIILSKLYKVREMPDSAELPKKYEGLQIRIAVELFSKVGAEGETVHSENGISRTYENAGVSNSLINEIVPYLELL